MTEKFIRTVMDDGSEWDVPVRVIADHKGRYYANIKDEYRADKKSTDEEIYNREFEELMNAEDDYDIIDWAENNMDWSDVEQYAVKVSTKKPDFQEGWMNGEKEIIKK